MPMVGLKNEEFTERVKVQRFPTGSEGSRSLNPKSNLKMKNEKSNRVPTPVPTAI